MLRPFSIKKKKEMYKGKAETHIQQKEKIPPKSLTGGISF